MWNFYVYHMTRGIKACRVTEPEGSPIVTQLEKYPENRLFESSIFDISYRLSFSEWCFFNKYFSFQCAFFFTAHLLFGSIFTYIFLHPLFCYIKNSKGKNSILTQANRQKSRHMSLPPFLLPFCIFSLFVPIFFDWHIKQKLIR